MDDRAQQQMGLLVIELVMAVGVFALCAAICVGLFVQADRVSRDSAALGQAVNVSQNTVERYKTVQGDLEQLAQDWGRRCTEDGALVRWCSGFDSDWQPVQAEGEYQMTITPQSAEGYRKADLSVQQTGSDETLFALQLAAEVQP